MKRAFAHYLIAAIEKKNLSNQLLAEELGRLWKVGNSTVYKKLNGEVNISLEEAIAAAGKFGISLDEFVAGQTDQILFRLPSLLHRQNTPHEFVGGLLQFMEAMQALPSVHIRYATNEIPVFYYMLYPELTAFKMYLWSQSVWESVDNRQSGPDWIADLLKDQHFQTKRQLAFECFSNIPSEEYYPLNMLDNTLSQIRYMRETGSITTDFARTISDQLLELTAWLKEAAENGKKGRDGQTLTLHYNEIIYTNNLILLTNALQSIVFSTLDNPNYLIGTDPRLVQYITEWFVKMKQKSIKISTDGERYRKSYFAELTRRIQEMKQRL